MFITQFVRGVRVWQRFVVPVRGRERPCHGCTHHLLLGLDGVRGFALVRGEGFEWLGGGGVAMRVLRIPPERLFES